MTKSEELHIKAMELASLAYIHKSRGDDVSYLNFTKQALELENQAAQLLKDEHDTEPTRSILFRSAASLAYNCRELKHAESLIFTALSGKPDPNLEYELRELLDRVNSVLLGNVEYEDNSYLDHLRSTAIHLRVQAKSPTHSKAIFVKNAVDFLKNISSSFSNFVDVNFRKAFEQEKFGDDYSKVLGQIISKTQLLVVDQRFKSFGVSISSDTSIMQNQYSQEINSWRNQLFDQYKDEVLYIDYESLAVVESISEKYNEAERNLIYKNFISTFREKNSYKVYITNSHYSKTIREYKPVSKPVNNILVPKIVQEEANQEKVLYQEFFMDIKDSQKPAKKSDIIERKSLDYAEFSHSTKNIEVEKDYLVLSEEWSIQIVYEKGTFMIELEDLGIHLRSDDYSKLIIDFYREVLTIYDNLIETSDTELAVDDLDKKKFLSKIVSMRSLKE
ncbi:hypothetical protein [Echinicola sp. 20G]|uniref:hypothetical protein n=1 Tax=Echinicola sp. 20G TaxID=2781961 RepID=UPI0019111E73|nr:hypothetical protein [Echinicola sp. 20G]